MTDLADSPCVPCEGGVPPLGREEIAPLLDRLRGWEVVAGRRLHRTVPFPDFAEALAFTNRVGALAQEAWHHPDLLLRWGSVEVTLYTHKIGGLSEADFVLAARIDRLLEEPAPHRA